MVARMRNFLSKWPPSFSDAVLEELVLSANTYALAHGFAYLPIGGALKPVSAIHAPYTLIPSPFPRRLFESASRSQHIYNVLYSRVASDHTILDTVLGDESGIGHVDNFTGRLWRGWKDLRDQNLISQTMQLGLFRSDYLMHQNYDGTISLKQVEFNTISSSFGTLSTVVRALHSHLIDTSEALNAIQPQNLPENNALKGLAEGLAFAHKTYGNPGASMLMVVQKAERNLFDQKLLEYELMERHNIKTIRFTLQELAHRAHVDATSAVLTVTATALHVQREISVVYYRAGYTPSDYETDQDYKTRFLLEQSQAIKCPSIPLQLAGSKIIQEYLARDGVVDSLLLDTNRWRDSLFTTEQVRALKDTWMRMWTLDYNNGEGIQMAIEQHQKLVLKPQREGGGNNIYRDNIPSFLDNLSVEERAAWIAMELIEPPAGAVNWLVKSGDDTATCCDTVNELGIYGWALFSEAGEVLKDDEVGWLLRTKGRESNEGGIAVGISVLDSPLLKDE